MGLALFHLTIVTLGAASLRPPLTGAPGAVFDVYNRVTGSGFGYSFFTPGIYNQLAAKFDVVDAQGTKRTVPLTTGLNAESDLRMTTVIDEFSALQDQNRTEQELRAYRRSLSASLARVFFRRYPGTEKVVVRLEDYEPVSRVDFNQGKQPKITTLYRAEYAYRPRQPASPR